MDYGYQYPPTAYKHIPAYRNMGISVTPHFKIMDDGSWRLLHAAKHIPAKRHLGVALVMRSCFVGALLHGQSGVAIYIRAAVANKTTMAHPSATGKNAAKVVPAPVGQVVKVMPVAAKVTSFWNWRPIWQTLLPISPKSKKC